MDKIKRYFGFGEDLYEAGLIEEADKTKFGDGVDTGIKAYGSINVNSNLNEDVTSNINVGATRKGTKFRKRYPYYPHKRV